MAKRTANFGDSPRTVPANPPLLFLDIDGVLNGHEQHANKFCGIGATQAAFLNQILADVPDLQIVVSSAWRYMILGGAMTLKGFEHLLQTHGVCAYNRLHGHTEADLTDEILGGGPPPYGGRAELIERYVDQHQPSAWAVVDDLLLAVDNFVQTDPKRGLTEANVADIVTILMWDGATP
jgi:hypothetical protein